MYCNGLQHTLTLYDFCFILADTSARITINSTSNFTYFTLFDSNEFSTRSRSEWFRWKYRFIAENRFKYEDAEYERSAITNCGKYERKVLKFQIESALTGSIQMNRRETIKTVQQFSPTS